MSCLCSSLPSITVIFKVLRSTVLASTDPCCRVVCCSILNRSVGWKWRRGRRRAKQPKKKKEKGERASDGVRGRDRGKESLQGKWMVGMRVEAQWMSCTLGWGGVLEVLCRGSRGHSGCDWHQNNISWQTTLVKGRGQRCAHQPHLEYQQPFSFYSQFYVIVLGVLSSSCLEEEKEKKCREGAMPLGIKNK